MLPRELTDFCPAYQKLNCGTKKRNYYVIGMTLQNQLVKLGREMSTRMPKTRNCVIICGEKFSNRLFGQAL